MLHTLRERSRKVRRKKRQRYSNEFRRNGVERMNACDNIIALAQGARRRSQTALMFGVVDPPRPMGSALVECQNCARTPFSGDWLRLANGHFIGQRLSFL
jgi:hypothetical protein